MFKKPYISIIIPVYNAENYLDCNIRSLLADKFTDFEIILVDDGSTDSSATILDQWASTDSRVRVVHQANHGAGLARNKGLQLARGEYILFLDADDEFATDCLQIIVDGLERSGKPDILIWKYKVRNQSGKEPVWGAPQIDNAEPWTVNLARPELSYGEISSPSPYNKIFRHGLIKKYGLTFQNLTSCNDVAFVWLAMEFASSIFFLNETLYTYNHGRCGSISEKRYFDAENILTAGEYVRDFLLKHGRSCERLYRTIVNNIVYESSQFPAGTLPHSYDLKIRYFLNEPYYTQYLKTLRRNSGKKYVLPRQADPDPCKTYVIIAENAEDSLEEFLNALPDVDSEETQIICCDNGSWDNTAKLLHSHAQNHANVLAIIEKRRSIPELIEKVQHLIKGSLVECYYKPPAPSAAFQPFSLQENGSSFSVSVNNEQSSLKRKKQLKLSIIMPVHNTGKYLAECLDSILKVKDISYELICIDDGSSDNSFDILLDFQTRFTEMRIASTQNQGPGNSRNIGLNLARGQYIEFIDSDDMINASMLPGLIRRMDNDKLDVMSISGQKLIDGKLEDYHVWDYKAIPDNLKNKTIQTSEIRDYVYLISGYTWLNLYRRELVEKIGNRFPDIPAHQDTFFLVNALAHSTRFHLASEKLYIYRMHPAQITKNRSERFFHYLRVQKIVVDLYYKVYGRKFTLKYLNYISTYFKYFSQQISESSRDEYLHALGDFYNYCLNKS